MKNKERLKALLIDRFNNVTINSLAKIPSPTYLKGMEETVERIYNAVQQNERIVIIGDYDVDGVVSTSILLDFFEIIDYKVQFIIPNRFSDGYGISPTVLSRVNADLIITVDNGITAITSAQICKERNIDLIITDHHTPLDELPDAYTIINPKQKGCDFPFKEICGAQVTWYLIAGLKQKFNLDIDLKIFLDLVAIAIIADVMPLFEINRVMVKEGLGLLNNPNRFATQIIKEKNKSHINSETIGFSISPKLNSAGRVADASLAVAFLRSKSLKEAEKLYFELENTNQERKEIELSIFDEADKKVNTEDDVIVVWSENWHDGVIGIVASRLVSKYKKPAIVFSIEGDSAKASARGVGEVDIFNLIKSQASLLIGFGGHKSAAGLSCLVDNLVQFKIGINSEASKLDKKLFIPQKNYIDGFELEDFDLELHEIIEHFEPYGHMNEKPQFYIKSIHVDDVKYLGQNSEHIKMRLNQKGFYLDAIAFRNDTQISKGDKIDISGNININYFNNNKSLQFLIQELIKISF